jgi:hypothetical protein
MAGISPTRLAGVRLQSLLAPQARTAAGEAFLTGCDEPRRYAVDYLRNGTTAVSATMVVTSFWTAEHHACAAVALCDPVWQAS